MADYTQPDAATKRVRFFDGQFLQDQDFIDEQKYHLDRERRTPRELGVPGVLGGLEVTTSAPYEMTISAGTAVDALGRYIVLDEPLVLTFPKTNVTQAFPVSIMYREVESDIATTGGQSATRWDESPMAGATLPDGTAVVAPSDAPTTWDDPVVGLGSWVITNGSFVAAGAAQAAGLRVPGPLGGGSLRIGDGPGGRAGLVVDANGQVGVGTAPDNGAGWGQLLDVAGSTSTNLAIRTQTIDGRLIANDSGYWQAPAGQIIGTGSNHPVTIATQAAPRLTVAANGDVAVGATAPENAEQWSRTLDVYGGDNVKLSVRTSAVDSRVMAHAEGRYGAPPGQIIGVTTNHAVSLVTQAKPRLAVTGDGRVGIGTVAPATGLDLLGTLQVTAPSSLDTGPALFVDAKGQVGVGTTTPENAEAWYRTLDLYGSGNAKLSVRASGIDTRVMAHSTGIFGAPAGQIIGTKTAHPVSLATAGAARMIVTQTGNVGIGTLQPAAALDVAGGLHVAAGGTTLAATSSGVSVNGPVGVGSSSYDTVPLTITPVPNQNQTTSSAIVVRGDGSKLASSNHIWLDLIMTPASSTSTNYCFPAIRLWNQGPSGWGYRLEARYDGLYLYDPTGYTTQDLHVRNLKADSVSNPSDARLKTDVAELDDALGTVARLRGVRFSWTDEARRGPVSEAAPGQRHIGVLAQDVAEVLPELVQTDTEGLMSVDYSKLTAVLVQAVKELAGRLALLETKAGR